MTNSKKNKLTNLNLINIKIVNTSSSAPQLFLEANRANNYYFLKCKCKISFRYYQKIVFKLIKEWTSFLKSLEFKCINLLNFILVNIRFESILIEKKRILSDLVQKFKKTTLLIISHYLTIKSVFLV